MHGARDRNGLRWHKMAVLFKNCGLRIVIADNNELYGELEKALALFTSQADQLIAHDALDPPMHERIRQIRLRTEVARAACHMLRVEARINLFFFQEHKVKWDVEDPVSDVLQPLGFELKEGYDFVTEIETDRHQQDSNPGQAASNFPFGSVEILGVH